MIEFNDRCNIPAEFTGVCKIFYHNTIYHYKNGKCHNENGPAIIYKDGAKEWYIDGKYHREDGPALEGLNNCKSFYYKDKCYGYANDFTNETWKQKVKELKREEELSIFL